MMKRIIASLLTSIGLLSLNAQTTLAERAIYYRYYRTFYPSVCKIAIADDKLTCNYVVIGAFDNRSVNMKLCSGRYCFILILPFSQLENVANYRDFYVDSVALQKGDFIIRRSDTSMRCGYTSNAIQCLGELENGDDVAIYVR